MFWKIKFFLEKFFHETFSLKKYARCYNKVSKIVDRILEILIEFVKLSNNFLELDKLIIYLLFLKYSQTRKPEKNK